MKHTAFKLLSLLSLYCVIPVQAREILTTLPLYYAPYYYQHPVYFNDKDWYVDIFGGAYYRSADQAFSECDGTCKVPFSTLLFGQPDFTIAQAFTDGTVIIPNNPFVTISTLSPRFEYTDKGAMFGFTVGGQFGCERNWHAGFRTRLPIREIDVTPVCSSRTGGNDLIGETLADVYEERVETNNFTGSNISNIVFAARFDFLNALQRVAVTSNGGTQPMIVYNDPSSGNRLTIANQDVSNNIPAAAGAFPNNTPMVAVIESTDGSIPRTVRWGNLNSSITGVVQADGSGLTNLERGRFAGDINYAPLATNVVNQSHLFVVPTVKNADPGSGQLTDGAISIQSAINAAITNLEDVTALDFLTDQGFNFCNGRSKGLGDLDAEFFIGYDWDVCGRLLTFDGLIGARFPTSDVICDCRNVLEQPLGTNGHYQFRLGFIGNFEATTWCKFHTDFFYAWVLPHTERIPASFEGALVRNIGPCVLAKTSWDYLFANADVTFLASDCCGFNVGYQVYHKRCDKIEFCEPTATDLAGVPNQPLSASVAAEKTNQTQHKIVAEFFLRTNYCELFTGYDYAVAGKNAPVDTDFYLGMIVHF